MCAMVCDPYGGPDVLCLRNVPLPEPQDGDVLIRAGYAGVNPADSKAVPPIWVSIDDISAKHSSRPGSGWIVGDSYKV